MRVLFATDGGKQCDAAIETLKLLALNEGDEIKMISVVDMAFRWPSIFTAVICRILPN